MANRLNDETSPYLLQHADNPVDWQPWDEAALALARQQDKPILLSIGYSACHWCHVMAHESFADAATAAVMNEHFVNIKVDREERPDLDKVYQLSLQLLTQQSGGWPLTMFLDPKTLLPFFGGTYFPKTARFQLPSFVDLLLRISETFTSKRDELDEQGTRVAEVLGNLTNQQAEQAMADAEVIATARAQLIAQADRAEGGFGQAPKFPMPSTVGFLLEQWAVGQQAPQGDRPDDQRELFDAVITTLTKMARGGIFDHLGGGFCRYSTDKHWMIPHFEKMLYDNGQLLSLYVDALSVGPDELFEAAVRDTVTWLLREMRHPGGGFFASLDADSEGEEGKYYVWRRDQIKKLVTEDEYLVLETLYGLDKPANFEGRWNLHRFDAWRAVIERLSLERDAADRLLASGRAKLLEARSQRPRPGLDNKLLTAWNGMAIKGLAKAGLQQAEQGWIEAAQAAADFLRTHVWLDGKLYATWQDGPKHQGYLDDYANLLDGLLALLGASWRDTDAQFAVELADTVLEQFADPAGGFFFTANDHEALIYRPKPTMDDALPPGNGVLAQALTVLGHLFAQPRYLDAANDTLAWARGALEQYPAGHCSMLRALQLQVTPPRQVIIRTPDDAATEAAWRRAASQSYEPTRNVFAIPFAAEVLPSYLPRLVSSDAHSTGVAYVCEGLQCSLPIESPEALQAELAS